MLLLQQEQVVRQGGQRLQAHLAPLQILKALFLRDLEVLDLEVLGAGG